MSNLLSTADGELAALATYRAAVRLALQQLAGTPGTAAARHTLVLGMSTAESYLGAAAKHELMGTACLCGHRWGDEQTARRHVEVMSLPNVSSGECDCSGERTAIPVFEGRCTGCGALLYEDGRRNRREVVS